MEYVLNWGEKNHKVVSKEEAEKTDGSFKFDRFYRELYVRKNNHWIFIGEI